MTKIEKIRRFLDKGLTAKQITKKGFGAAQVYQEVKRRQGGAAVKRGRGRPKKIAVVEIAKPDMINPDHYKVGGVETIDFIEAKQLGYHLGNVVKYVSRAYHKGNPLEDLQKAKWYLERHIAKLS